METFLLSMYGSMVLHFTRLNADGFLVAEQVNKYGCNKAKLFFIVDAQRL